MSDKPSTRLFAILARDSRLACIFRRGPSKQVQLIKWDRKKDTFEFGQWLKGRIYERRCDLSPDGEKLVYLAAKWKSPVASWTAISRPPYLTALVLWPNRGAWGGGGLFEDENTVCLNHRFDMQFDKLGPGFQMPRKLIVKPLGCYSGHGEDDPIYHNRLLRDGWELIEKGKFVEHPFDPAHKIWITFEPPIIYRKVYKGFKLVMQEKGWHEWGGATYVIEYALGWQNDKECRNLGRMDWADWDRNGELLFARSGRLYRLNVKKFPNMDLDDAVQLADFRDSRFEECVAPAKYCKW